MDYQKLYRHIAIEHGLFLLDSQMEEIVDIVLEMHNEKPEKCTEAIKQPSNNDLMKTIAQQLGITDFPFEIRDREERLIYEEFDNGNWIKWQYDKEGNEVHSINSDGYEVHRRYDENGFETYYKDSQGIESESKYDENGNMTYWKSNGNVFTINRNKTPHRMKTAMQQLIEELKKRRSDIKESYRYLSHLVYVSNMKDMLIGQINAHIQMAEAMLEKEKEQLDKAWQEGAETAQNDAAKEIHKNYTPNKL